MSVRATLGHAADHTCVGCGGPADHWSYNHDDPSERRSPEGMLYSPEPSHYSARCVPCHKTFDLAQDRDRHRLRSEEHTSELQSLMRISYAVFCLKKKKKTHKTNTD